MRIVFYFLGHYVPGVSADPIFVIPRNNAPLERAAEKEGIPFAMYYGSTRMKVKMCNKLC